MAPVIDMGALTALVRETGVEYITNSKAIRRAWEDIAEKYCEDKGVPPIHYKIFSVRWKNQKFYSKKKAKMQELGVTHKELVQIRRDLSNAENSSQPPSPKTAAAAFEQVSQPAARLEADLAIQELKLKVEEIQQRLKFNEELFMLQRQKLSLDIERSTLILNHPCLLKECDDDSECEFDFVMEKETDL